MISHRARGAALVFARAGAVVWLSAAICVACGSLVVAGAAVGAPPGSRGALRCLKRQIALAANVCAARGDTRGRRVFALIRSMRSTYSLRAVVFGVWDGQKQVISGAVGNAYPGVDATRAMHIRIGNTTESIETTLLLQLVDRRKIRLSDHLSKWFPGLPDADKITVAMLASSTSGYFHYVKDEQFINAVHANPFRKWTPPELVAVGMSHPMLFAPGTSWSFSDTNFVLLGEILRRVGGTPVPTQIKQQILKPLGMTNTQMTATAYTPSPVLHGYTSERGRLRRRHVLEPQLGDVHRRYDLESMGHGPLGTSSWNRGGPLGSVTRTPMGSGYRRTGPSYVKVLLRTRGSRCQRLDRVGRSRPGRVYGNRELPA